MKRRVILISLSADRDLRMPIGHASLMSALKWKNQIDVFSLVRSVSADDFLMSELIGAIKKITKNVPHENIDIAVGAYVWVDKHIKTLLVSLRDAGFIGRIILGGPQVTYTKSGLEHIYPEADVFIRGSAEQALCEVALSGYKTPFIGVHFAGDVDSNVQAKMDFSVMPSPWLTGVCQANPGSDIRWETQRGCNFKCSFCQHRQRDARMPVLMADTSRIESEIDLFCKSGVRRITILDPVFNKDTKHAVEILGRFSKNKYQGELSLQCRAEMINEAFLDAAQELNVCLEFGLQSIHKREYLAVGRPNYMEKISAVLEDVARRKIKYEISLIYGLPEQTLTSFKSTVQWCLDKKVPVIKAFPLLLLRGTQLFENQDQWSFVVDDGDLPMVLSSNTFGFDEWREMDAIANALSRTEGCHGANIGDLLSFTPNEDIKPMTTQLRSITKGR